MTLVDTNHPVGQTPILIYLRSRSPRNNSNLPLTQPNGRNRYRRLSNSFSPWLLSITNGRPRVDRNRSRNRSSTWVLVVDYLDHLVHVFGKCDLCGRAQDGFAEIVGRVSCGIALWLFCPLEHIQREKVDQCIAYLMEPALVCCTDD
jgi:hypothetical protein